MIKEGVVSLLGFSFFSIWLLDVVCVCARVQVCVCRCRVVKREHCSYASDDCGQPLKVTADPPRTTPTNNQLCCLSLSVLPVKRGIFHSHCHQVVIHSKKYLQHADFQFYQILSVTFCTYLYCTPAHVDSMHSIVL